MGVAKLKTRPASAGGSRRRKLADMRLVRGGTFRMGSDRFYPEEAPVRPASVGDFWIDETPVTNAAFAAFVADTGYVTLAEMDPPAELYPGLSPELLRPGSSVFAPPEDAETAAFEGAVPNWWRYVFGADWRRPLGPGSGIEGREDHPVVHVVAADAEAYAAWAGKSLPTEAEWEYAARGGLDGADYAWGEEFEPGGVPQAKTWSGVFPHLNAAPPGLERTAPVRSYAANGFGLYDMIANVWEWTADWYATAGASASPCCGGAARDLARASVDPHAPTPIPRRVLKGGSHLCTPNYCKRYRPAARWPQPIDTSTSHIGFRCIVRR